MNVAIIFAGGTGQRMNTKARPKQFLEIHGKPVIIYTLEHFQSHDSIDKIVISCVSAWMGYCQKLVEEYQLTKVVKVVAGGSSGQASIFNGLITAGEFCSEKDIVLIHDGVRPLINEQIITDCIACVKRNGSAITVAPAVETIFIKNADGTVGEIFQRSVCEMAKAPQCFFFGDLYNAHLQSQQEGRQDFIDSASLMQHYGYKLYSVNGPSGNIKITTPVDFYIFRAILDAEESFQIAGL